MTENCDLSGWFGYGHIWYQCRGTEEACIDVELVQVSRTQAQLNITPSWGDTSADIINKGEYKTYNEPGYDGEWRIYCDDISYTSKYAKIRICYIDEETPVVCADHTDQTSCESAGCYWYDGRCHGSPHIDCSDHIIPANCIAAGCYWYDGACHASPGGSTTCSDQTNQSDCESHDCYWYDGSCHGAPNGGGDGHDYTLPLYGSTTILGHKFTNNKIECAIAGAVIKPEGLTEHLLIAGGEGVIFAVGSVLLPGSVVTTGVIMGGIYVALKSLNAECTEAQIKAVNATYTQDDHDDVSKSTRDDLNKDGYSTGDGKGGTTPGSPKTPAQDQPGWSCETDPNCFTKKEMDDAQAQAEKWWKASKESLALLQQLEDGLITEEEYNERQKAAIKAKQKEILFTNRFSLTVPGFVMAGKIKVSGVAPLDATDIDIMVEKTFLGFNSLAADSVIATFTSAANHKYSGEINLDEFGSITIYARIKKEMFGIDVLAKDVTTEKHTVWVITPFVLIALVAAAAMMYDKKTKGKFIGMFKK